MYYGVSNSMVGATRIIDHKLDQRSRSLGSKGSTALGALLYNPHRWGYATWWERRARANMKGLPLPPPVNPHH